MKTWEIIKELTEHPEKKFRCTNWEWINDELKGHMIGNTVSTFGGKICYITFQELKLSYGAMQAEWEEVKQPYTFLEALEEMKKGKRMRSNFSGYIYIVSLDEYYQVLVFKGLGMELDKATASDSLTYTEIINEWFEED